MHAQDKILHHISNPCLYFISQTPESVDTKFEAVRMQKKSESSKLLRTLVYHKNLLNSNHEVIKHLVTNVIQVHARAQV